MAKRCYDCGLVLSDEQVIAGLAMQMLAIEADLGLEEARCVGDDDVFFSLELDGDLISRCKAAVMVDDLELDSGIVECAKCVIEKAKDRKEY